MAWLSSGWRLWILITTVMLVAYGPALSGGFLWDDRPGHVTKPELQSLDGLRRIWFEIGATQQYYPVLHSAFWVEHRLWGDATFGYHLLNVLLHATAACLFAAVLRRLAVPGAAMAAWLFALHPVAVESVAWISEQKNTLSAVLYLGAALAYLRFDEQRRTRAYVAATTLFVLALLTKTVTATLPAALLVVFWWRRGRISWREDVQPLLLWFGAAVAGGLLTAWFESTLIGAQGTEFARGVLERCLLPAYVIAFYLWKLLWPANLAFIYPRWNISGEDVEGYLLLGLVAAVVIVLWLQRKRTRAPLAVALLFIGTLFPVLGFFNVYPFRYSYVADHFQYLAMLAPLAAVGAMLATAPPPNRRMLVASVIVIGLAGLTRSQSAMYRDPITLYTASVTRNPGSWMAQNNLAEALTAADRPGDAIPHLEQALRLKPDSAEAENNLGDDLRRLNRPQEAIVHLKRALQFQPNYPEAHNNLGAAFMNAGDAAEGKKEFETAVRLRPGFALAHFNLGLACANSGDVVSAARHFADAVALQPDYAEAEMNWGIALLLSSGLPAAAPHFERSLTLEPNSPDAHYTYARALARAGRLDEAITHFDAAVQLNPAFADAHMGLAMALRQRGRTDEAAAHYAEARRLGARP